MCGRDPPTLRRNLLSDMSSLLASRKRGDSLQVSRDLSGRLEDSKVDSLELDQDSLASISLLLEDIVRKRENRSHSSLVWRRCCLPLLPNPYIRNPSTSTPLSEEPSSQVLGVSSRWSLLRRVDICPRPKKILQRGTPRTGLNM